MNDSTQLNSQRKDADTADRQERFVKPDFTSVCEYVTFEGSTISEALRKAADWLDASGLGESESVDPISVNYDDENGVYRLGFCGHYESGATLNSLVSV